MSHLVINTLTGQVNCDRCGGTEEFNSKMPLPLKAVMMLLECYGEQHSACPETNAGKELKYAREQAWKKFIEENPYECSRCKKRGPRQLCQECECRGR